MLPFVVHIRVCIDVDDLEKGVHFFTSGLGLHVGRSVKGAWAEMLGASAPIDLLRHRAGTPAVAGLALRRDFGRHWTPVHLDFVVDDIDSAIARATAAGATLERPVRDEPYGRIANLADPFGNGICLLQMSERGYDALVSE
jgi:predicted enzyme related to lactoylglutathione lyase